MAGSKSKGFDNFGHDVYFNNKNTVKYFFSHSVFFCFCTKFSFVTVANLSFPNDFYQHSFGAVAVEFAVEDLLPWAEIELAFGDCDHNFSPHDLPLVVRVAVVFPGPIMPVSARRWIKRSEFFQPLFVVFMQARFVVIDEN